MPTCNHAVRHGPLCAFCGETVSNDKTMYCLLHNTDTLRTTSEEANKIARKRKKQLDATKKLILIIDLDHTLIHATLNQDMAKSKIRIVDMDLDERTKNLSGLNIRNSKGCEYGGRVKEDMEKVEREFGHINMSNDRSCEFNGDQNKDGEVVDKEKEVSGFGDKNKKINSVNITNEKIDNVNINIEIQANIKLYNRKLDNMKINQNYVESNNNNNKEYKQMDKNLNNDVGNKKREKIDLNPISQKHASITRIKKDQNDKKRKIDQVNLCKEDSCKEIKIENERYSEDISKNKTRKIKDEQEKDNSNRQEIKQKSNDDLNNKKNNTGNEKIFIDITSKFNKSEPDINVKEETYKKNNKRKIQGEEQTKNIKLNDNVIYCFRINGIRHFIRVRPSCHELLESCSENYEMHIYTMGNRAYADNIVRIIDPSGKYFEKRIISRDENMDQRIKSMDRLSSDHRNIVILDDRGDIWNFCSNLIMVRPFHFFKCGDINAPEKIFSANKDINIDPGIYPAAYKDIDLKYVNTVLKIVYENYFDQFMNVKKVMKHLRKEILQQKRIMIDYNIHCDKLSVSKIIKNCSGKLRNKRVDYIFASDITESALNLQKETRADIVNLRCLFHCYMYFKPFDYEKNMLKAVVDDDLVKEFESYLD